MAYVDKIEHTSKMKDLSVILKTVVDKKKKISDMCRNVSNDETYILSINNMSYCPQMTIFIYVTSFLHTFLQI